MGALRKKVWHGVLNSPLYPHPFFLANPFKMYEFNVLMHRAPPRRTDVLLDIGCGPGLQTSVMGRKCARVIGIDVSENDINRALSERPMHERKSNAEFRCTSIEDAGFEDGMFDKIFSVCVIEHIPDYQSVLRECHRVLKPGGVLALTTDSLATIEDETLREKHMKAYHVVRYFTPDEIRHALMEAGFVDVEVKPIFTSAYARERFIAGIHRNFSYRYTEALAMYLKLCLQERMSRQRDEGVFLAIRCRKAS